MEGVWREALPLSPPPTLLPFSPPYLFRMRPQVQNWGTLSVVARSRR